MTAQEFIDTLTIISHDYPGANPKREIFALAKQFQCTPVPEVVLLLQGKNPDHRLGAISILDWKARDKKTSEQEKEAAYLAYTQNHDYINDWGLVDRAAPYVVGGYLFDKSREPLFQMAKSQNPLERRTAIVSTYFFIRKKDTEDTFRIAEILVHDPEQVVQTAVGSWIREAGKQNEARLELFLEKYAKLMPRVSLRYAIEKLDSEKRNYYLNLGKLSK